MDALSDVLRVVRLTGGIFLDGRFTAPWSLVGNVTPQEMTRFQIQTAHVIGFHYVVKGRLIAHLLGGEPVELKAGEIVLLPHNDLHVLASAPGLDTLPAGSVVPLAADTPLINIDYGGGGEETKIVCGFLGADAGFNPLIQSLPPILTLNVANSPGGAWIVESFAFAAAQVNAGSVGGSTIMGKLSELMFVEAVRRYVENLPPEETGWLAGLRDPAIAQALSLMHAQPNKDWTAEELAQSVNLSRSTFAERFTALIGQPPMRYLTLWRMQLAAAKLRDNRQTIAQIAFDVGYESEAAFTRAFRREYGAPPATWRKQAAPA
jgi:AraC-like DNA-binding protein